MHPQISSIILFALAATQVTARPRLVDRSTETAPSSSSNLDKRDGQYVWNKKYVPEFIIHESCNASETAQLRYAFEETTKLANHAKEHILVHGAESDFYKLWFGEAKTGEPLGWYEKIANGDKGDILWRCDDVDRRCSDEGL